MTSPLPSARRRRTAAPDLVVRCPACGREARAEAVRSPGGWVHAGAIRMETLLDHVECDLFALSAEFGRVALSHSRIRIAAIFGESRSS
ncbi:MAG TPA: hypothetical protein VF092_21745 [Longimicrobium sp.]